jgi:hypothetical protein
MKKTLFLMLILFTFSKTILAGQYLGFDLCKTASEESLKKIVDDAGVVGLKICKQRTIRLP